MKKIFTQVRKWIVKEEHEHYVLLLLATVAFTESIIFPLPVDIFTLGLSSIRPKRWFFYALIATLFSVLGALVAYIIGMKFSSLAYHIASLFHYEALMLKLIEVFRSSSFLSIFTSAFTPIPYKVFTLSAGVASLPLFPFLTASLLGRGLRFFLESYLGMKFGEEIAKKHMRKTNIVSFVVIAIIILIFLARKFL